MGNKTKFYANIEAMHDEVTGSCILVSVSFPDGTKTRFLVDCGLYQETTYENLNSKMPFDAEKIDYVFVTHNHVDHIGRLPLLVKNGYRNYIYMSEITSKIMIPALTDSYKVLNQRSKNEGKPLIYSNRDVSDTIDLRYGVKYNRTINLDENIRVTFLQNGHLLGAAMILVQISYNSQVEYMEYEDINLLFTGDYKKNNVFFEVKEIPKWVKNLPLTIIQEATYGDILTKDIEECFAKNIRSATCMGKEILIPAFSQGRFQEIMLMLKRMQENGTISKEIPIYLDGNLAQKYTWIFLKADVDLKMECQDFVPDNSYFVDDITRKNLLKNSEPKIIVSSSGMGSYGPARGYLPIILGRKKALIQFSGYTAEGTLGRRVLDAKFGEKVLVGGQEVRKLAKVETTSEFSGHAKSDEMIEFLSEFDNIKLVLINHGEVETKQRFKETVEEKINTKDVDIMDSKHFYRINAYGLVKKINA